MAQQVRFVDSNISVNSGGGTGGDSVLSSSYASTSSYSQYAVSASYALSASHEIVKEVSSSYADTASYAITASYALNGGAGGGSGIFNQTGSYYATTNNLQISGSLKVSGSTTISLASGSAFSVIEEDAEAAYTNRLDFAYDQQDPTLTITARSATSLLHLKTGGASTGTTYNSQGEITRNSGGTDYGVTIGTSFSPKVGNQMDLGFYNRRWKNLYINTGDKIGFGVNTTPDIDLVSLRHTAGTNELVISGSSDVTLDVKGNIISTGSLQISGSVDIAIPSGSAFTITETDKSDPNDNRLDFFFDDGDPTLLIESRVSSSKIILSRNDGDSGNVIFQSDGQVFTSGPYPDYTGSIKFVGHGILPVSAGITSAPFIGSNSRPFYKYYMAQIGGQFISDGTYAKQQFFLNSAAQGYQRSDGKYNQASGMRLVVSGSPVPGATGSGDDGYLRNPNNVYLQIQDDSTGTGNDASIPFRVCKSGSLAINLNQSKGFGFQQYYTASAMVHVEAEPNYDLNLFQGNNILGTSVFHVNRVGDISGSDLRVRDGRFSRDGGAAEVEIIASEIAGGIIGTQTSDDLHFRRFNINKFTLEDNQNISHQSLEVEGNISASGDISASRFVAQAGGSANEPSFTFYEDGGTGMYSSGPGDLQLQLAAGGSPEITLSTGQMIARVDLGMINHRIYGVTELSGSNGDLPIGSNLIVDGAITASSTIAGKTFYIKESGLTNEVLGSVPMNSQLNIGNSTYNKIFIGNSSNNADITAYGNVSSSAASTASFGTYLGDGSQLTGIETDPFPYDGDAIISGSLTISGSLLNTGTVSIDHTDSPYTLTGTQQFVLINPLTSDVIVNLPDAATYPGREIKLKLTENSNANTVTLQCQGADTIDGAASNTTALDIQYEAISVVSDGGTNWFIF